jgi:hypothetical protein
MTKLRFIFLFGLSVVLRIESSHAACSFYAQYPAKIDGGVCKKTDNTSSDRGCISSAPTLCDAKATSCKKCYLRVHTMNTSNVNCVRGQCEVVGSVDHEETKALLREIVSEGLGQLDDALVWRKGNPVVN